MGTTNNDTNGLMLNEFKPSLSDVTNNSNNTSMNGIHDSAKKLTANITKRIDAEFDNLEKSESTTTTPATQMAVVETIEKVREVVKDVIDEFRDEMMSENFKFKSEIFKEFMMLRDDMRAQIERHSVNGELIDEIYRLKEENKRLKKLF